MTIPDLSSKTFNFSNPLQNQIFTRLQNLVGPGPALFYRDACILMELNPPLPTTTHLVAHLLRDIESALRDVLEIFIDEKQLNVIRKQAKDKVHQEEVLTILSALGLTDDSLRERWLGLTGKENYRALHSRAHRNALAPPRQLDAEFQSLWSDMELILNVVLDAFETKYLVINATLDRLKGIQNPTDSDVALLKGHIPNNFAAFSYFFQGLENPNWLLPLFRQNIFSYPTAPIVNEAENTVSHPLWPQSGFLLRMAAKSPEQVTEIALAIETENSNVQFDLIDMAIVLSPSYAARFVPKFKNWLRKPHFFFAHKVSPLIIHLLDGGEFDGASMLSRELLGFDPVETQGDKPETSYDTDAKSRIESYEYTKFIRDVIPAFVKKEPYTTFVILVDLLREALEGSKFTDYRDYSDAWRPAIEPHPQNSELLDEKNSLVSAIRDTAQKLLEDDPNWFDEIIESLERQKWHVFKRIALHFIREFGDEHMRLVRSKILNLELFDSTSLYHEYILLLGKYFKKLKPKEKNVILKWIEDSAEGREARILRRLAIIKDDLPKDWKVRFDSLLQKYDAGEHPDLLMWTSGVKSGPVSPLSQEQIEAISMEELVSFLQEWQEPSGFTMESPEGISRTLTSVVATNPERFAGSLLLFTKVHPTYVRGILAGFREALKAEATFDWQPVLQLMKWVVEQGPAKQRVSAGINDELDPDWGWTRMEIARLLESALNDSRNLIGYDKHKLVWEVIEPLTSDPDPTPQDDEKSQSDPATRSLNTTRGMAFHTLIVYALWRKRSLKTQDPDQEIDFDQMPEVRKVLDDHLNTQVEPSPTVRSVFGWKYSYLFWLDRNWALTNRSQIFPTSEAVRSFWNASWAAFISFTNPSGDLLQALQAEHQFAIRTLDKVSEKIGWGVNAGERLAENLMIHYAWGGLELDSPLFEDFWGTADISYRSHALHFVGTSIKEKPSPDFIKRFQALWESRVKKAKESNNYGYYAGEMKEFGWWFSSSVFPEDWSLDQLDSILNLSFRPDDNHFVFERLADLSKKNPFKSVASTVRLLAEATPWKIAGTKELVELVLRNALNSQDENAAKLAREFINRFSAKGYTFFSHLLSE